MKPALWLVALCSLAASTLPAAQPPITLADNVLDPAQPATLVAYINEWPQDLQPLRFDGRYKRPGFSYPKSVLWGKHLYVAYATNKEDVELTRVSRRSPWIRGAPRPRFPRRCSHSHCSRWSSARRYRP